MARTQVRTYDPRPRDVPGFSDARMLGRLPRIPPSPPRPLPGTSADHLFWGWIATVVGSGLAWFLVFHLVSGSGLPAVVATPLLIAGGLTLFWAWWWRWPRAFQARKIEELRHGYTTLTWVFGGVGPRADGRFRHNENRIPWDYRGIWVLASDGRVLSAPDPSVEPPGFFPSPNRPGSYELWTGSAWYGTYRDGAELHG